MKFAVALLLTVATTASAQQSSSPPQAEANPSCAKQAAIAYQPPKDLILFATQGMEQVPEDLPSKEMSQQQYRSEIKLLLTVGEDGFIREVVLNKSSGSRLVDRAARNWAYGLMFSPLNCGESFQYQTVLPVVVPAHAGGV